MVRLMSVENLEVKMPVGGGARPQQQQERRKRAHQTRSSRPSGGCGLAARPAPAAGHDRPKSYHFP